MVELVIYFDGVLILQNYLYIIQITLMIGSASVLNNPNSIIRYHDPYSRLYFRIQVQRLLERTPKLSILFNGIDIAAIIDAVSKRGGSRLLGKRIKQVLLSLPYYDPNIIKHAILILQNKTEQYFHDITAQTVVISETFVQQHLLPVSTGMLYYELDSNERYFMQDHFSNLDEYFCIKTLAFFGANISRLDRTYYGKYYLMRRWMFINDYVPKLGEDEFRIISMAPEVKICIVGISVANIILGIKLSKLGLRVRIMDFSPTEVGKWVQGYIPDIIKLGVYLSNEVEAKRLHCLLQQHMGLSVNCLYSNQKTMPDQNIKIQNYRAQQQTTQMEKYQQIFICFLEQIFREYPNNSDKLMWDELNLKAISCNNISEPRHRNKYRIYEKVDVVSLKAYYDRLIQLAKLKNCKTATVADIHKFVTSSYSSNSQNKMSKIKMAINYSTYTTRYEKMKQSKLNQILKTQEDSFSIEVKLVIDKFEKQENKWRVGLKAIKGSESRVEQFDYLVYGACRSAKQTELSAGPLSSLFAFSSIHCLYRFKQKVYFRSSEHRSEGNICNNYSYYSAQFGMVHFYLLGNSDEVLACLNYNNASMQYYKDIGLILNNNVLRKPAKMQLPTHAANQYSSLCTYYHTQEQEEAEALAISRQDQNIYLNPPIIKPIHNGNVLANSLRINNLITSRIVDRITNQHNLHLNIQPAPLQMQIEEQQEEQAEQKVVDQVVIEEMEGRDWFGLECKLVGEWKCVMANVVACIDKYTSEGEGSVSMVPSIQITSAIPLTGQYPSALLNIGLPYLHNNSLHLAYFTSIRISGSLLHSDKVAIFYQTCVIYNEQVIYCIVELQQQHNGDHSIQLILFHNKLDTLVEAIAAYDSTMGTRYLPNSHSINRVTTTCYVCPGLLVDYIRQCTQLQRTYSQILNNKIQSLQEHQHPRIPPIVGVGTVNHVYNHACELIKYYCRLYSIGECTMGELLVGRLNLAYIVWEIGGGEQGQEDRDDESGGCLLLLRELMGQQDMRYSLKVSAGVCSRRFIDGYIIDGKYYQSYTFYSYKQQPHNKNRPHALAAWAKEILHNLLCKHIPVLHITHELHALIQQQIQTILRIMNMRQSLLDAQANLYNYLLMTRLAPTTPRVLDRDHTYARIKQIMCTSQLQLTKDEEQQLQQMINEEDIATFGNEFILAYFQQS